MLEVPTVDDADQARPAGQDEKRDERRDVRQVVQCEATEARRNRAARSEQGDDPEIDGSAARHSAQADEHAAAEQRDGRARARPVPHPAVQRLRRYYLVRQTAGLCRYLLALDRDTSTRAAATYQQILSGATLVQMHPGGYAISPDPELYGVGYFYADVVTAQVTQSLRAAYGVQWWTSPACGQRLQQVWQHCSVGSPADLVRAFGHRYISLASLLRQLVDDGMDGAAFRVG